MRTEISYQFRTGNCTLTSVGNTVTNQHTLYVDWRLALGDQTSIAIVDGGGEKREVSTLPSVMCLKGIKHTHAVRLARHVESTTLEFLESLKELSDKHRSGESNKYNLQFGRMHGYPEQPLRCS